MNLIQTFPSVSAVDPYHNGVVFSWLEGSLPPPLLQTSVPHLCYPALMPFWSASTPLRALKGVRDQKTFLWNAFLWHLAQPFVITPLCMLLACAKNHGSEASICLSLRGPSFRTALWSVQCWALQFGKPLQYDGSESAVERSPVILKTLMLSSSSFSEGFVPITNQH